MEISLPYVPTPSKLSIGSALRDARFKTGGVARAPDRYDVPVHGNSIDPQTSPSNGTLQDIRRVASNSRPWVQSLHLTVSQAVPQSSNDRPPEMLERVTDEDGATKHTSSETENTHRQEPGDEPERQSAIAHAMRSSQPGRSVSRGRSHLDKTIEATLANADPGQNIRSRKASHYMGVFREVATPPELNQRGTTLKAHGKESLDQRMSGISVSVDQERPCLPSAATMTTNDYFLSAPATIDHAKTRGQFSPYTLEKQPDGKTSPAQNSAPVAISQSQPTSPLFHNHDPYFRKQDAMKTPLNSQRQPVPPRLLEQIRDAHNLTPMHAQGIHQPARAAVDEEVGVVNRRSLHADASKGHGPDDEEHISSAVYYPHPGPTPEDLEQIALPSKEAQPASSQLRTGTALPNVTNIRYQPERHLREPVPGEHIDISVQSKHGESVFHGNYQPRKNIQDNDSKGAALPSVGGKGFATLPSPLEPEVGSGDEIGEMSQTEDGETTPTKISVPESHSKSRQHIVTPSTPTGAVVLEPYRHQVGGHSTIFRFSRRAVCKQLNNRENEFYERIESRHPDVLRFLPRLVVFPHH